MQTDFDARTYIYNSQLKNREQWIQVIESSHRQHAHGVCQEQIISELVGRLFPTLTSTNRETLESYLETKLTKGKLCAFLSKIYYGVMLDDDQKAFKMTFFGAAPDFENDLIPMSVKKLAEQHELCSDLFNNYLGIKTATVKCIRVDIAKLRHREEAPGRLEEAEGFLRKIDELDQAIPTHEALSLFEEKINKIINLTQKSSFKTRHTISMPAACFIYPDATRVLFHHVFKLLSTCQVKLNEQMCELTKLSAAVTIFSLKIRARS